MSGSVIGRADDRQCLFHRLCVVNMLFWVSLWLWSAVSAMCADAVTPGKEERNDLNFTIQVSEDGWGKALPRDITQVLVAVTRDVRANFGELPKRVLIVEHDELRPITLFKRGPRGEFVVRLNASDTRWAQIAYQFAHEICHILANYETHQRTDGPNQWFEETLCEASSLYALRRMAVTWKTAPPFPNWAEYAAYMKVYADQYLTQPNRQLPGQTTLASWFAEHRDHLSRNGVDRDLNGLVANLLLPLFEQDPSRWDAIRFLNVGEDEHDSSLAAYLASWRDRVPLKHKPFIQQLLTTFGFPADVTIARARTL